MDPSGTWNLPSNPSWTLDIKNQRPPSRPAWHPSPSIISGVSLLPSPQVDPPRDRGSTQKQRSRRTKTLQAARAKARKFKGLLGSNKTPWGLGSSSCNGFKTLSRDLTRGRDFVYQWNSLKFQPAIPKCTGVLFWEDNSFRKKANKRPHEPQTERPLSIARNGCRALQWCGPF